MAILEKVVIVLALVVNIRQGVLLRLAYAWRGLKPVESEKRMIYETVTEFIEHFEHCYALESLSLVFEGLYAYLNKDTGMLEVYDSELDYQYTLLPWVALTGRCPMVAFPPMEPTTYDR